MAPEYLGQVRFVGRFAAQMMTRNVAEATLTQCQVFNGGLTAQGPQLIIGKLPARRRASDNS